MPIGQAQLTELTERQMVRVVLQGGRVIWIPCGAIHETSELYGVDDQGKQQAVGARGQLVLQHWWPAEKGFAKK